MILVFCIFLVSAQAHGQQQQQQELKHTSDATSLLRLCCRASVSHSGKGTLDVASRAPRDEGLFGPFLWYLQGILGWKKSWLTLLGPLPDLPDCLLETFFQALVTISLTPYRGHSGPKGPNDPCKGSFEIARLSGGPTQIRELHAGIHRACCARFGWTHPTFAVNVPQRTPPVAEPAVHSCQVMFSAAKK